MITSTKTPKSIKAKSPKTPKALKALISLLSISVVANAGVPVARTVDVSATIKPVHLETYAGETLDLSVQLASGGSPLATPSASATIYWQTNGMANAWWQTNMSCSASGLVTGSWSPGLPSGRVWFFVGVESSGLNYRIAGQCSILPSPGGAPSTAVLPPPGGTLNLGDYTVIGAPWITSSDSAAAISSAISPLSIAIASISERAASAATSASNYTDSVAAPLIASTNSLTERLDAIVIPDVSGFASKTSLQSASNSLAEAVQQLSSDLTSATNELHTSLAPTISAASTALQPSATNSLLTSLAPTIQLASTALQPAVSNALAQATASLAQTVEDNAQQSGYDLAAASNALAQATAALAQTVAANAQQSAYDLAATSNALSTSLAPTVQLAATALQPSATNGIPEEITSATNALNQSLAPTISSTSNALAQATSALAQKVDGLAMAMAASNTAYRLMSLDGDTYQDATGTVWQSSTSIGISQWYFVAITYTNGTTIATNEIPGISSWSIDGEWYGGDVGAEVWIWTLRVPSGGSEYSVVGGAEDASPSDMSLSFNLDSGDISGLSFARTNTVTHYWAPVDHVLYASSGGGGGGLTTNDVCNIVTNEVAVQDSLWTIWTNGVVLVTGIGTNYIYWDRTEGNWTTIGINIPGGGIFHTHYGYIDAPSNAVTMEALSVISGIEEDLWSGVAQFTRETQNALGLARLIDLPPLTNGLPTMADIPSTNGFVTAAITNGCLPKSGGTIYDPEIMEGSLTIGNSSAYGILRVNGYYAALGVGEGGHNDGMASVSIGGLNTPSTLTVGGTNVMEYVAQTGADAQSAITSAATDGTNYTDTAIANADTTYTRFAISAPTNINQSVQYLNITAAEPSTLSVLLPEGNGTKDWILYVNARTNVSISLPAATWWMADVAFTNDIQGFTPTALYFSQIDTGLFIFSRQELTEVVTP